MLLLASSSERRKEILQRLGVDFIQCMPTVVEIASKDVYEGVMKNALVKAKWCAERHPEHVAIGFDTVITLDGNVLGKPASRAEAKEFLSMLSGRGHKVITGIAVVCLRKNIELIDFEETKVFFRSMSENEIEWYLSTGEWEGKAGAYAIQGKGGLFVERIEGCYFNVVGLPVGKVYEIMKKLELNEIFLR